MKILAVAVLLVGLGIAPSQAETAMTPAEPGPACLQAQFIDHTHTVNPSTVLFYMRDGKIWQNDLPVPCNGLKFHGFAVTGHEMEICSGQGIGVIKTHQVCQLGKFTTYTAPAEPAH